MKSNLNYLLEVKHIQDLTQQKQDEYVFITYRQIWRLLKQERQFFKGYRTFLKYISEPRINQRIEETAE